MSTIDDTLVQQMADAAKIKEVDWNWCCEALAESGDGSPPSLSYAIGRQSNTPGVDGKVIVCKADFIYSAVVHYRMVLEALSNILSTARANKSISDIEIENIISGKIADVDSEVIAGVEGIVQQVDELGD